MKTPVKTHKNKQQRTTNILNPNIYDSDRPLVSENVPNKPQNVPKKNELPGTPLVSENVPNKPQNVP